MRAMEKQFGSVLGCQVCDYVVQELNVIVKNVIIQHVVEDGLIVVCSLVLQPKVCNGYISQLADVVIDNLLELILSPGYLCAEALQYCARNPYVNLDPKAYIQRMLHDKPENLKNNTFVNDLYKQVREDPNRNQRPVLKMVQFTDIHMDLLYAQGASTKCK